MGRIYYKQWSVSELKEGERNGIVIRCANFATFLCGFFLSLYVNGWTMSKSNAIYVGYSESKYRLRISLAHPPDCRFARVQ